MIYQGSFLLIWTFLAHRGKIGAKILSCSISLLSVRSLFGRRMIIEGITLFILGVIFDNFS
ncbi:hypothetical protein SMUE_06770 [Enterococcus cecorum]